MSKPDKPIRIFISCIPQEMEKELYLLEKEVFRQLLDKFSKLEFYCSESAKLEEDFTLNLARIDECDLFIALLGERYGETAQFSDRRLQFKTSDHSQLEIEVRYALQLSKPIQIYTRDPSFIEALPASERANDIERPKMVRSSENLASRIIRCGRMAC